MRPLERRILAMVEAGTDFGEIARRFRRSPEFISRVIEIARLPHEGAATAVGGESESSDSTSDPALRPIERLVLKGRAAGVPMDLMARQFKRSTAHVERIADLATYKLGKGPR
ncbi:MAG: hypothetical protein ACRD0I_10615 [Acidimicrobiales bacterium]